MAKFDWTFFWAMVLLFAVACGLAAVMGAVPFMLLAILLVLMARK